MYKRQVVHRDGQDLLRRILPDHVLIQHLADLFWRRQLALRGARGLGGDLVANDVVAKLDAFVADEHRGTGDQLLDFMLALDVYKRQLHLHAV